MSAPKRKDAPKTMSAPKRKSAAERMSCKARAILTAYCTVTFLIAPLGALFLCYKKRRDPPYGRRAFELLGCYHGQPKPSAPTIWFHTVSVGEAIAARPLIREFVARHPERKVIVTTTTTTGAAEIQKIEGVQHVFAPLDSPLAVNAFIRTFKPSHLFIMETELWPCLLHSAQHHGVTTVVFNARMPEKTCLKYQDHLRLSTDLIAGPLDLVLCQTKDDQGRFARIGVPAQKIKRTGSLKYDLHPNEALFQHARSIYRLWQEQAQAKGQECQVLGAISTHEGEEEMILETYYSLQQIYPNLRLILVPRHQSGVTRAQVFLQDIKGSFALKTEFDRNLTGFTQDVLLGNTMGEIEFYLGLCDLIFMGGSLVDIGGHNPLEPAYFSLPIITGRYYYNFHEQYENLIEHGGAYVASDHHSLYSISEMLLQDKAKLTAIGMSAFDVQQAGRGAIAATLQALEATL